MRVNTERLRSSRIPVALATPRSACSPPVTSASDKEMGLEFPRVSFFCLRYLMARRPVLNFFWSVQLVLESSFETSLDCQWIFWLFHALATQENIHYSGILNGADRSAPNFQGLPGRKVLENPFGGTISEGHSS